MNKLEELRSKIDDLDTRLLDYLNERAQLAQEIGKIKHQEGLPIYAPGREESLLRSLIQRSKGPLPPEAIRSIYREIMSASLALEKDIVIACFGTVGEEAHRAACQKFGSSVRYAFFEELSSVFNAVEDGTADYGVVPIEERNHGFVNPTLDLLTTTDLTICSEIYLRLGLNISEGFSDRFLVLARNPNPPSDNDKTMLLIRIEDKPGSLLTALAPFKEHTINLGHIASRPASQGSEDIFFFVEAECGMRDMQSNDILRDLSKSCRAVKTLGSYPNCVELASLAKSTN